MHLRTARSVPIDRGASGIRWSHLSAGRRAFSPSVAVTHCSGIPDRWILVPSGCSGVRCGAGAVCNVSERTPTLAGSRLARLTPCGRRGRSRAAPRMHKTCGLGALPVRSCPRSPRVAGRLITARRTALSSLSNRAVLLTSVPVSYLVPRTAGRPSGTCRHRRSREIGPSPAPAQCGRSPVRCRRGCPSPARTGPARR
jgi:hypothetical protein